MIRKISDNEQLYIDMQDSFNDTAMKWILEVDGKLSRERFEESVNFVIENSNGVYVRLIKNEFFRVKKSLEVKKIIDWRIRTVEEIFNLKEVNSKINCSQHNMEIYFIETEEQKYIFFKILHASMDGKGILLFLKSIFTHLNEGKLLSLDNSMNEMEFIKDLEKTKERFSIPSLNLKLKDYHGGVEFETINKLLVINGYHSHVLARVIKCVSKYYVNDESSYMIPTSIRKYKEEKNYIGNLVLPTIIKVNKDDDVNIINYKLLKKLKASSELNHKKAHNFFVKLPKNAKAFILKKAYRYVAKNHNIFAANISYLSKKDIQFISGRNFEISNMISMPVHSAASPFSISIREYNNKTNISIAIYKNTIPEKVFEKLLSEIEIEFCKKKPLLLEAEERENADFIDIFEKNCKIYKDKIAVCDDMNYTYRELNDRALLYSNILNMRELKQGDVVVLYLSRSFDLIALLWALIKLGITYITVDKSLDEEQLSSLLKKEKVFLLISDADLNLELTCEFINIKNLKHFYPTKSLKIKKAVIEEDDVVYKIFTSGTTGVSKKIEVTYKNLNNYLSDFIEKFDSYQINMPLFTSLSVDLTVTSLFLPLLVGGRITVFREDFSNHILQQIMSDEDINFIKGTPTHFRLLGPESYSKDVLILSGENLTVSLASHLQEALSHDCKIYNEYGPAETTVGSSLHLFNKKDFQYDSVPIGKPIRNTKIYLMNDNRYVDEEKQVGEIVIQGQGVTRPLNSNFSFIHDIATYFTGDLGYIEDGRLHYIGREDGQLKINGKLVNLRDIEKSVRKISQVLDCHVLYDSLLLVCIKAKLTYQEEIQHQVESFMKSLKLAYKIIFVEEFLSNKSGKLDIKSLTKAASREKLIKDAENEELLSILEKELSHFEYNKGKNLYSCGIDSFDIIYIITILCKKYEIEGQKEKQFTDEIFSQGYELNVDGLKYLVDKYKKGELVSKF